VHLEQRVVEVHPVRTAEGVEGAQGRGAQGLGPSRGQPDERGRLELEPADDLHDPGVGAVRRQEVGGVDVEHHEQPFAGRGLPAAGVVLGEVAHPPAGRRLGHPR
jgi:hypothetical protein